MSDGTPTMGGERCGYDEILDPRYGLLWNVELVDRDDRGARVHLLDARTGVLIMASKHVSEASAELLYGALARALGARAQFDRVVGRLLRLEAIVEQLAKTQDGVRVPPAGCVYGPITGRRYIVDDAQRCTRDRNYGVSETHPDNGPPQVGELERMSVDCCFSTPEAAEAARKRHAEEHKL